MKAYVCDDFGPLEQHAPGELPAPEPGEGQVRVRVAAAGVNFYDTLIVQGKYQVRPVRPFAPGGEIAGVVDAVGPGVTHLRVGQRVMAFTSYGGYAELTLSRASMTWPLPDAVGFESAAAGVVTYGTAWFALQDLARLAPGETVLVLGAAGGVGLAAVQIAKRAGARVIAAAGSPERLALCREAGADDTIDYVAEDLKDAVKAATGGRGADVVVDVVGGDFTEKALRATAWRGRLLVIGFAAGQIPKLPANLLLLKGCHASGVFWDEFLRREPEAARAHMAAIAAAWADGSLTPPISARYPLERAGEALDALAQRRASGKLIIQPAP
ncbi:MAG: NADPH:quinone oxidoreductase family protein [Rhodocyclaceae bacterium]|nr:NADPH:quinone oxidoreductase family protein [Rhodocyclaceae bacterium]